MNQSYPSSTAVGPGPSLGDRIRSGAIWTRDTLDQGGRPLWLAAMIVGFVVAPPLGFAILFYMLWSKRMFSSCRHRFDENHPRARWAAARRERFVSRTAPSGNTAFDAYREETLRRLEEENEQFVSFLGRLRDARDKAEFDQFMRERQAPATGPDATDDTPRA